MALTLTGPANTQRLAASKDIRWVVEIDWDFLDNPGSWDGKYSDQIVVIGGDTYEAFVKDFEPLDQSLDLVSMGATDSLRITFKTDDAENFFAIFLAQHGEGRPLRIGYHYLTTGTADIIYPFEGTINEVGIVSKDGMVIDIVSFGEKAHRDLPLRTVNESEFPNSLLDDRGKRVPIVYGDVEHCPGVAVSSEQPATLFTSITEDSEIIPVDSLEGFLGFGIVAIDNEEILYNGISFGVSFEGEFVAALTDCTRGFGGTERASHESGAVIAKPISS